MSVVLTLAKDSLAKVFGMTGALIDTAGILQNERLFLTGGISREFRADIMRGCISEIILIDDNLLIVRTSGLFSINLVNLLTLRNVFDGLWWHIGQYLMAAGYSGLY